MNKWIVLLLLFTAAAAKGQPLRDVNYRYLYDPESEAAFSLKTIRSGDSWTIQYRVLLRDTARLHRWRIDWQAREGLNEKDGALLSGITDKDSIPASDGWSGSFRLPAASAPKIVLARLIDMESRRAWLFYHALESNYPVNNFLVIRERPHVGAYITTGVRGEMGLNEAQFVSYYNDDFPPAAPAFSEGLAKVPRAMEADSLLLLQPGEAISFVDKGLYLFQRDTSATEAYSVRAENDYPRYSLVGNLPGPLVYICTKQEYDRLQQAGGDKKAFDRTVLNITGDTDRARHLMRTYFRRVELANTYFTSYKEGWKTDRGMIYIVFGLPQSVYRFYDREVWKYDNEVFKATFDFVRAPSIFDPENYVLVRDKKYRDTWYAVVDLWRNARF